jgi:leucyl aminopeptidase
MTVLWFFIPTTMSSNLASLSHGNKNQIHNANVWLIGAGANWPEEELGTQPKWLKKAWEDKMPVQWLNLEDRQVLVVQITAGMDSPSLEKIRKQGAEVVSLAAKAKFHKLIVTETGLSKKDLLAFSEGAVLASYRFDKYKSDPEKGLKEIVLISPSVEKKELKSLSVIVEAVAQTRNLVNEPAGYLTAKKLSEIFEKTGKDSGFDVEVLGKNKIQSLKMGGLLGVNQGSDLPPTFNILEYKPKGHTNKKPIVLVGKGVVYDTGGHSLKTSSGMEYMKCDMAGSATVLGIVRAVSELELPLHVIGLIPATDNRISAAALSPGDVITISDGTTVEVLNTDAEGRLILADALVFAKKYDPELVFDFATLTGAAARAIGREGFVFMGTASDKVKYQLLAAQNETYERGVEFPVWDEYGDQIKSDVADLKNIGGAEAGAITAGKFLQHFTSYPWLHFDIAGPAFYEGGPVGYIPKGGTGFCVRMVVEFLKGLG